MKRHLAQAGRILLILIAFAALVVLPTASRDACKQVPFTDYGAQSTGERKC